MSTIPTQNPVPSEAAKDLKFNSGKIDEFVTSMKNKYIDRFGQEHFTIEGLRWIAQQAISQFGYITLDSFQKGAEITLPNQVLRDEVTGEYYRWDGALPKVVPIDSTPDSSGGIGVNAWLSIGDASLRRLLESTDGAYTIGTNSGGTVQDEINRIGNDLSIKSIHSMPIKFLSHYKDILHENVFPQGLAEDDDYWYITEDVSLPEEEYSIVVSRIDKLTLDKYSITEKIKCHGQGIGVLGDGVIFVGGSSNSLITIIDFNKNSTQEKKCIGFYKDFPFCFDRNKNLIYQLQDDSAVGAKLTRISILSLDYGFISSMSLDREIMTTGYPQGITTDGNTLYINSGGSWSSSYSGAWNNKWSLFRLTTDGVILNRITYTRDSMGSIISRGKPAIIHEPQGIYFHNGKLSFLQYIGNSDGTYTSIFSEDDNGEQVKAVNKNRFITYSGLGDIGVNERGLETGKTILNIIESMQDNSSISFSLNNIPSFSHDTGINFGTCVAYRVTRNRAFAISTEQSSAKNPRGKVSIVHVYGDDNWQSPPIIISGEIESSLLYSSSSVITPKLIPIPDIKNYHSIVINLTNDQPSNPKTKIKFSSEEINYNIKNGLSFRLDCASSWVTFSINTNGVLVHSSSGNAYVTSIIGM